MYVKTLSAEGIATLDTPDPGHPIEYAAAWVGGDPSEMTWEQLTDALGVGSDTMDRHNIYSEPTGHYDSDPTRPFWKVGWVRYRKPGSTDTHLVAATTPIYILDATGKTIDRV